MDLFGLRFSWIELIMFVLLFFAFIHQFYFYARYLSGILRQNQRAKKNKISSNEAKPPVSIIIAAKNEENNLLRFLPQILEQNYPEFEVIVIDDASTDNTAVVFEQFKAKYSNLRTTFIPQGTKNLSSKKLAITLGVKAAKYDILLFTDADCYPESNEWIAQMIQGFKPETEFVLGYGAYLKKDGFLNRLITYDTLFIAMQYMGMAIAQKPYMGVGRNMAYRKETFFNLKGFSSNLNILSGDDDLLVNKGCTKKNTNIEISKKSITWSEPETKFKNWYYQKVRHISSSAKYKKMTKIRLIFEPVTRGLFYLSFIATTILGNTITLYAAAILFLLRLILQMTVINKTSSLYDKRSYFLTLPILDIFLPLVNLFIATFENKTKINWK